MSEAPLRVLVVDDEDVMRKAWLRMLRAPEFEVASAARADEAVAQLARAAFDVVVLDVVMPGMTGLEALPEIRRRWPEVEVVMMTAYAGADAAAKAVAGGAFALLGKPFESIDAAVQVVRDA